jgi:hypothetical protein
VPTPPLPPPLPDEGPPPGPRFRSWAFVRRNRHWTVPVAVPFVFGTAGVVLATTPRAGPPVAAATAVFAAVMWWAAGHKWDRAVEQWYARASAVAAGTWLAVAAAAGMRDWLLEVIALGAGTLAWGIPWWWHKRPRHQPEAIAAAWNTWWMYYAQAWNVAGSHVEAIVTAGVIDTLTVQLWAGRQSLEDIKNMLSLLESALQGHVERGMTRCETVRGNPSQVLIHLKRKNPHAEEVDWDPSLLPDSVTGTMALGKNEHREWEHVPCLDGNWFVLGAEGGGKSNELSVMLASITHCPDALVWLIDRKGGKAARPWLAVIDWVATTTEEARLLLATAEAEIRARGLHGYDGNEQMVPTVEVPAIYVVIDEAHNIISEMSGDPECRIRTAAVASEGRSSAVRVIILTQYGALYESVGSEQIRGNLRNRICFRVAEAPHGQFALEDWKNLDASRLEHPGEFYYRLSGMHSSAPLRGPHMPHPLVRQIAAANARTGRPPLVLYATGWQATYDGRHDRLPPTFRSPGSRPAATSAPEAPVFSSPVPESPEQMEQRIEDELASIPDLPAPPLVDEAEFAGAITRKKMTWAALLTQAPPAGIRPKDLIAGSGLSPSWTYQQLAALTDRGVITKPSDGRYLPVAGQDVWAGLEQIRQANADLARQAKALVGA